METDEQQSKRKVAGDDDSAASKRTKSKAAGIEETPSFIDIRRRIEESSVIVSKEDLRLLASYEEGTLKDLLKNAAERNTELYLIRADIVPAYAWQCTFKRLAVSAQDVAGYGSLISSVDEILGLASLEETHEWVAGELKKHCCHRANRLRSHIQKQFAHTRIVQDERGDLKASLLAGEKGAWDGLKKVRDVIEVLELRILAEEPKEIHHPTSSELTPIGTNHADIEGVKRKVRESRNLAKEDLKLLEDYVKDTSLEKPFADALKLPGTKKRSGGDGFQMLSVTTGQLKRQAEAHSKIAEILDSEQLKLSEAQESVAKLISYYLALQVSRTKSKAVFNIRKDGKEVGEVLKDRANLLLQSPGNVLGEWKKLEEVASAFGCLVSS